MLATMLPSHADDGAVKVTCPRHDVDAESYGQQCCRVILVMVLPRKLGCGVM
jgi:hypothetical protein